MKYLHDNKKSSFIGKMGKILFLKIENAKRSALRKEIILQRKISKYFFREFIMARFIELAELFEELEKITSHKEIVKKIANFFYELERNEVKDIAYLFLAGIGPAFESTTLGVGDKLACKAIAEAYGAPEEEVKKRYSSRGGILAMLRLN